MILPLLQSAVDQRRPWFDAGHHSAFRLFNGHLEGYPDLVVDVYARTLLIHDHSSPSTRKEDEMKEVIAFLRRSLDWLEAGIVKTRNAITPPERRGQLVFGEKPDRKILEHDTWYAINLTLNRDASFYLDTRNLRKWMIDNMKGKSVLNMFAYTGSIGVAAHKAGAERVVQVDLNREFLNIAKESHSLNGFPIQKGDFIARDFFEQVGNMKRDGRSFDCVVLDPPFFSTTARGRVDLEKESARLINKVRPLISNGGNLIVINNALYLSGLEFHQTLESLCRDGYMSIRELIPVPQDVTGFASASKPITDPAPFNHSTKIAILDIKKKSS